MALALSLVVLPKAPRSCLWPGALVVIVVGVGSAAGRLVVCAAFPVVECGVVWRVAWKLAGVRPAFAAKGVRGALGEASMERKDMAAFSAGVGSDFSAGPLLPPGGRHTLPLSCVRPEAVTVLEAVSAVAAAAALATLLVALCVTAVVARVLPEVPACPGLAVFAVEPMRDSASLCPAAPVALLAAASEAACSVAVSAVSVWMAPALAFSARHVRAFAGSSLVVVAMCAVCAA